MRQSLQERLVYPGKSLLGIVQQKSYLFSIQQTAIYCTFNYCLLCQKKKCVFLEKLLCCWICDFNVKFQRNKEEVNTGKTFLFVDFPSKFLHIRTCVNNYFFRIWSKNCFIINIILQSFCKSVYRCSKMCLMLLWILIFT